MTQPWTPRTRPPLLGTRADAFPTPPTAVHGVGKSKKSDPRLRAGKESDNTHGTYRVAAFQTFLSGRISTFGDNSNRADGKANRKRRTFAFARAIGFDRPAMRFHDVFDDGKP